VGEEECRMEMKLGCMGDMMDKRALYCIMGPTIDVYTSKIKLCLCWLFRHDWHALALWMPLARQKNMTMWKLVFLYMKFALVNYYIFHDN
jgi:hypothetical protein